MASLKVWHFFPNPLDLSDAWTTLLYTNNTEGRGEVPTTGWGLPDVSIIKFAPTEYIVNVLVRYRKNNTAGWKSFSKNIRYNDEMYETQNVIVFMPYVDDNVAYTSAHAAGNLTVNKNYDANNWVIYLELLAYLPGDIIQFPKESGVFEANQVAMQGVNIYY